MSQQLDLPSEESSTQPIAVQVVPTATVLQRPEPKRVVAVLRPVIATLILLLLTSLIVRGIEIRISDITISLGR